MHEQDDIRRPHVIVVGQSFPESRTTHRVRALQDIGCDVTVIPITPAGQNYETTPTLKDRILYRLRRPADPAGANEGIIASLNRPVDIIWLDAANIIRGSTLREVKARSNKTQIVWYSEDDTMNPVHRTKWLEQSMPLIDLWVTTKSFNARPHEVPSFGVKNMMFTDNVADPDIYRPMNLTADEGEAFGSSICFIGTFEEPRANSLMALAEAGLPVRIWGNGWSQLRPHPNLQIENRAIYNDDFSRAVSGSDINLCFLRHVNRDLQTCRSVEIPCCGGFMVHERNTEITELFRENQEAVYFSSDEELISVCKDWLRNDAGRREVADAGRRRVEAKDLTPRALMRRVLAHLDISYGN